MRRSHSLTLRTGAGGGGDPNYVNISDKTGNLYGNSMLLTFKNDGTMTGSFGDFLDANQWLTTANQSTVNAALYQIRFTVLYEDNPDAGVFGGVFGSWLDCSLTQTVSHGCALYEFAGGQLKVEIRGRTDLVIKDTATYTFYLDQS